MLISQENIHSDHIRDFGDRVRYARQYAVLPGLTHAIRIGTRGQRFTILACGPG